MVREVPMVKVKPVRKRMSPRANSVESKRKSMPRNKKVNPKNIRPVPILVLSETILRYYYLIFWCRGYRGIAIAKDLL